MIQVTVDDGVLTEYERHALSLGQIMVLAAFRQLKTQQRVARFLQRGEKEIGMVLVRIRQKGITL